MKTLTLLATLFFFTEAGFSLGVGGCIADGDFCPEPTGIISFDITLAEHGRHSIVGTVSHYSDMTDMDRGTELGTIKYRVKLWGK